ncbi:MAG TPA: TonB-dependent receptor [Terriglobales bacterium]
MSSKCLFTTFLCSMMFFALNIPSAWAQHGNTGTVAVTVLDQSGRVVTDAQLQLQDLSTGDVRKAQTTDSGTYSFVNLNLGNYKLTVSKSGFQDLVFTSVVSQAAQTTDLTANLKIGVQGQTVQVEASASPVVEETSNAISTTIDLKQIENLPIQGRDLTQLSQLVAGYNGTYDGLPSIAQGNNIDGVIGSSSRMKFGGNSEPNVQPRLEDMQEMTVQTEQLNLDQGYGQANMQLNFVTRRGGNQFHGRVYEDFRNSALNANSWSNDTLNAINPANQAKKNALILNEFGFSVGGPIIKNKLFFFGTYAEGKQPGAYTTTNYVFTQDAQNGIFNYNGQTINLFTLAANYNASHPGANLPTTINSNTAAVLQNVNTAIPAGQLSPSDLGDPNVQNLNWQVPNPTTQYFPTIRVDYNASDALRFNLSWNMTKTIQPGENPPDFPGSAWTKTGAGNSAKDYTVGFGFDWTLSPNLINSFRAGFLYNNALDAYNAPPLSIQDPQLGWNYTNVPGPFNTQMSGTVFYTGIQTYYPVFNASDTMTFQHGAHTMNYGFSWWREQDHYYNPAQGFPIANYGLANGDPALNAFTIGAGGTLTGTTTGDTTVQSEAQQLYAILTGRLNGVTGAYPFVPSANDYQHIVGRYNLDELQKGSGLFFQDSYRFRPNLTINYGLRWDFTSADKDLSNLYHSVSEENVWGPSGVGNIFNPGVFHGNAANPVISQISQPYNNWNVAPQPAIGIAWNPANNRLGRLIGGDKTVVRAGFSLRKFTEPQQYVWNQASDYGSFYYQGFGLSANGSGAPGTFQPGSLSISNFDPNASDPINAFGNPYVLTPAKFVTTEPIADFTFLNTGPGVNGIKQHIQQPYTESWNLGIQRQLGENRALELRYIGSLSPRQWVPIPTDEVNIFENGFLQQFQGAQGNLAVNQANGVTSFANNGLPGQVAIPIFDAAFAGEGAAGAGIPLADYGNASFIRQLTTGSAGAMAGTLAGINGTVPYFCNLVGVGFAPCANNLGFTGAGAGYPINFFQTNPYAQGTGFGYPSLTEAEAISTYHALQVDFRQRSWHGLQFDANYTWSHTLGNASQNNWQGQGALFTVRDMHLSYGPTLFDLRHVVHINGTYDLPFGRGKQFANSNGVLDKVVGGWTIGSIFTFKTGSPFLLQGTNQTFNDYADGGVVLNGVTASQLQSSVGARPIPGTTTVAFLDPKYYKNTTTGGGGASTQFILPNTAPGTIGQRVWLYGPHATYDDVSITKDFAISEEFRFNLQAVMLNAFNHPTFGPSITNGGAYFGQSNVTSGSFATGSGTLNPKNLPDGGARTIELRANFEF